MFCLLLYGERHARLIKAVHYSSNNDHQLTSRFLSWEISIPFLLASSSMPPGITLLVTASISLSLISNIKKINK